MTLKPKQEVNKRWCRKTLDATSCSPPHNEYSEILKTVGKSSHYCFSAMPRHSIRFAVRSHDGATTDIWKCWTQVGSGKKDVYLTSRPLGHAMKLSLHQSGRWHVSFHQEELEKLFPPNAMPASRFLGAWDRTDATTEPLTLAARVCFPWTSPSSPPRNAPKSTQWIQCAPQGEMVEVTIFLVNVLMAEDGWPGRGAMETQLVGRMPLDGGGQVVIVSRIAENPLGAVPKSGSGGFFRGKTRADLDEANRIVLWGESPDGSVTFYETRFCSKTRPEEEASKE